MKTVKYFLKLILSAFLLAVLQVLFEDMSGIEIPFWFNMIIGGLLAFIYYEE